MSSDEHRLTDLPHPRPLNEWERGVLRQVLSRPFLDREIVEAQATRAQVAVVCRDCPTVGLTVDGDVPLLECARGRPYRGILPCELAGADVDGMPFQILVHVSDGRLAELEIYRGDGEHLLALPNPARLGVICE